MAGMRLVAPRAPWACASETLVFPTGQSRCFLCGPRRLCGCRRGPLKARPTPFMGGLKSSARGVRVPLRGVKGMVCGPPSIPQGWERVGKFPRGFLDPQRGAGL